MGCALHRDLALLHGLQQRRLGLGRGAVDLVGQQQTAEHGSGVERELVGPGVVDVRAGDVGREQVGRALEAAERQAEGGGQAAGGERLAQPGHVLDEHVATGQHGGQGQAQGAVLAHHHLADARQHGPSGGGDLGYGERGGRGGVGHGAAPVGTRVSMRSTTRRMVAMEGGRCPGWASRS